PVLGPSGSCTAVLLTRLDGVAVAALGLHTGLVGCLGGGLPHAILAPAAFVDWPYFALAAAGGMLAFGFSRFLHRLEGPITVLDAIGLSTFAVIGASKALAYGLGIGPSLLLGVVTGVGGGTMRDILIGRIPSVLRSDLYAIPALVAAAITVAAVELDLYSLPAALTAVAACFTIRMLGVRLELNAPRPPWPPDPEDLD